MGGGDQQQRLKAAVEAMRKQQARIDRLERSLAAMIDPIAVIGIGCRFPGDVDGPERFWQRLRDGFDAIGEVPADRWNVNAWYDAAGAAGSTSTRYGGFLRGIDRFDARFFQISPREAETMDPQQRLLLEVTWHALEDATLAPDALVGSLTGVFVGLTAIDYARLISRDDLSGVDSYCATGNVANIAAGRLSYFFGFRGPSVAVDTACSSSLVSLHLACQSLRTGESTLAIAAGVNVLAAPDNFVALSRAHMLSPDGRCKAFDRSADGYGRSEGCGVLVLKRLAQARLDGDRVYGVILGSAVRQDGRRSGLTVPNGAAQVELMRAALERTGLEPRDVGYLEAHGTGTALGDPIEFEALAEVYGEGRDGSRPLLVGSLKTNLGHMESAAGIGGAIKALLAVSHGEVPPHLHFTAANPEIALDHVPATIPVAPQPWPSVYERRVAAVSSFGSSGTIGHVLIAAPPAPPRPSPVSQGPYVLPLSAKTAAALEALVDAYREWLARPDAGDLASICYSAAAGRNHFRFRRAAVGSSPEELVARLGDDGPTGEGVASDLARRYLSGADVDWAAFYGEPAPLRVRIPGYPFQGERHWVARPASPRPIKRLTPPADRMRFGVMFFNGTETRDGTDKYRLVLDAARFADANGFSSVWLPERHFTSFGSLYPNPATIHAALARETHVVRLLAGSVVLPLHDPRRVAEEWSVVDNLSGGRVGMSFASGWNPDDFALRPSGYATRRDDLFSGIETLRRLWRGDAVTASNGVGVEVALRTYPTPLQRELPLWVTAAANPETFRRAGELGAHLLTHLLDHDPDELAGKIAVYRQARRDHGHDPSAGEVTVMLHTFVGETLDAVHHKVRGPYCQYLKDNAGLLKGLAVARGSSADISTLSPRDLDDFVGFLYTRFFSTRALLGTVKSCRALIERLEAIGVNEIACLLDFGVPTDDVLDQMPRLAQLVSSQRTGAPATSDTAAQRRPVRSASAGDPALEQSLYEIAWTPIAMTTARRDDRARVPATLRASEAAALDADESAATLAAALVERGVRDVVCEWHLEIDDGDGDGLVRSLLRVVRLARYLALTGSRSAPRLWFVTRGAYRVNGHEPVAAEQRTLWGFLKVLPIEQLAVWGGLIDLDPGAPPAESSRRVADVIAYEGREDLVAIRDGVVFAARLVNAPPVAASGGEWRARADAAYLITGGFGGVGLSAAEWLGRKGARHVTLVGRHPLDAADGRLRALEEAGLDVERVALDVSDRSAVATWIAGRRASTTPRIAGVIHAAGVWGDCELISLDAAAIGQVFGPKVAGTLALDAAFGPGDLDLFVVFSAFSSLLPAERQANYAAANAFSDAIVERRRSAGERALTVNWGPWRDIGFGTTDYGRRAHQRLEPMGIARIEPEKGWALLERLIDENRSAVGVMPVDWRRLFHADPNARLSPLLSDLAARWATGAAPSEAPGQLAIDLLNLPADRQLPQITSALTGIIAGVMRVDPEELAGDIRLSDFGLDSLMAVEIKNRMQHDLGVSVPLAQLLEGPSIEEVATAMLAAVKLGSLTVSSSSSDENLDEIEI